ncbi:hypothetical protein [Robiginitalea biformata]|uniref:Uncharacterized protein n=1 Tax=Robiginitalea biformata (strain ATCC BAA-864 / DSM 15991 / KCTC 12146 / HTCC2501) TaxID=313596 RepID=A4CKN4_ROBBH|nr:hypothetical protein [Robiginitalea biformata]EAR15433.1 hypothetical protein RB2501_13934 [Robiginitalea biformata HTCC2501]
MEVSDLEEEIVDLTIIAGQSITEESIKLPAGKCVGMGVISAGADPTQIVNLSVLDGGSEVVKASDYRFSVRTNGGPWLGTLRNRSFDCNRNVTVRLASAANLAADLTIQVLFVILRD